MRGFLRKRGETWTAYWTASDSDGSRRQRSRGGFLRKKEAQAHLNSVLTALGDGSYIEIQNKTLTVAQFLRDHWLPAARTSATRQGTPRRPSTVAQYECAVEKWLIPHIGGHRLVGLTPAHLEIGLRNLAEHGGKQGRPLSGRSCQLAHGVLRQALDYGLRNGYVVRNVATLVDRPGAQSREMQCWTAAQAQEFLAFVADDPMYAAWVVFLARGPRRAEVAGLRWADVDLDAGTARIVHTRISVGGRVQSGEPKTAAGRRTLHLDAGLVQVLRQHRKRQTESCSTAGPDWTDTGYVFVRDDGRPPHPEYFSDRFDRLARQAGVPVIRLHDLRHTAVSLALADGTPVKVVQEMAGHSNPAITQGTYAHVMPGQHEAAGARLSGLLGLSVTEAVTNE